MINESGRVLQNRFVLQELIGSGGMGDIYKALDLRRQEAEESFPTWPSSYSTKTLQSTKTHLLPCSVRRRKPG